MIHDLDNDIDVAVKPQPADSPKDRESVLERIHADVQRRLMEHSVRQCGLPMEAQVPFAVNMGKALDASGLIERIAELEEKIAIAQASIPTLKAHRCNGERIITWMDGPKRAVADAFTAGLERDITYRVEDRDIRIAELEAEVKRKDAALGICSANYLVRDGDFKLLSLEFCRRCEIANKALSPTEPQQKEPAE